MNARTPKFNPLNHPVCLAYPGRLASTAWAAHIPFAMFIVDILRPRTIVELGVYSGVSYCAFCQAVKELNLDTRCFAIDTWQGDENSGPYGPEILSDLKEYHDPLYENFSCLIQSTFDDAVSQFENNTIDLLHIDGFHSYEAVKHDFESWLPKMSSRGVVLFHDINVKDRGFGVWKLWEEIKLTYPYFEFLHEHGLGVISTTTSVPDGLRELLELSAAEAAVTREFFDQLGQRLRVRSEANHAIQARDEIIRARDEAIHERDVAIAGLQQTIQEQDNRIASLSEALAERDGQIASLSEALTKRGGEIELLNQAVADLDAQPPLQYAKKVTRRGLEKLGLFPKPRSRTP